ncbi:MAG: VOC family protein [Pseudomonadota bacterium]
MRSSHILCKVNNLEQAIKNWSDLGFTVQVGDAPDKAINALIWFETGPFIELIDVKGAQPPTVFRWLMKMISPNGMVRRFENWQKAPEGWCEFSLETHEGSVRPLVDTFKKTGIKIFGPVTNKRTPPDSPMITTQTAFPHITALPILMGAYRPDPRPTEITHPNGATAVCNVTVGVPDEYRQQWSVVADEDDPWLTLVSGHPGVQSVTLAGLQREIDPKLANGAVIQAGGV